MVILLHKTLSDVGYELMNEVHKFNALSSKAMKLKTDWQVF